MVERAMMKRYADVTGWRQYYDLFADDFALLDEHGLFHPIIDLLPDQDRREELRDLHEARLLLAHHAKPSVKPANGGAASVGRGRGRGAASAPPASAAGSGAPAPSSEPDAAGEQHSGVASLLSGGGSGGRPTFGARSVVERPLPPAAAPATAALAARGGSAVGRGRGRGAAAAGGIGGVGGMGRGSGGGRGGVEVAEPADTRPAFRC